MFCQHFSASRCVPSSTPDASGPQRQPSFFFLFFLKSCKYFPFLISSERFFNVRERFFKPGGLHHRWDLLNIGVYQRVRFLGSFLSSRTFRTRGGLGLGSRVVVIGKPSGDEGDRFGRQSSQLRS